MATGTLSPVASQQFFDNNGVPLVSGLLYTYLAGTSTPASTYTDAGMTALNTNPVQLDTYGRAVIFLDAKNYKFILKSSTGVTIWTVDGVASTALASSSIGGTLFVFGGEEETTITDTSYPSGATYDKCMADTVWFSIDSANLVGTYCLQGQMRSEGGITTTVALVNLSDGTPDTPLVTITSTSATGERQVSSAITFPTGGTAKVLAVKAKVSSGVGYAWMVSLIRTA